MKKIVMQLVLCIAIVSAIQAAPLTNKITDVFDAFCVEQGYNYLLEKVVERKVNEKKGLIELIKNCEIVQFARFKIKDGSDVYVFSNYKSPTCAQILINQGCYKYENGEWEEQTNVLPTVNFLTLYGDEQKPPTGFESIGTTRVEINNKTTITLVLEQSWITKDDRKERILNQAKFSAVQLKWSKKAGKFKIKKWIR